MLKAKLQYFGHLMWRTDSLEKTLMLGKIEGKGDDRGWDGWIASLSPMDMNLSKLQELVMDREAWHAAVHGITKSWTWLRDWTELNWPQPCALWWPRGWDVGGGWEVQEGRDIRILMVDSYCMAESNTHGKAIFCCCLVAKSCPALLERHELWPTRLLYLSIHRIFQARILEHVNTCWRICEHMHENICFLIFNHKSKASTVQYSYNSI